MGLLGHPQAGQASFGVHLLGALHGFYVSPRHHNLYLLSQKEAIIREQSPVLF